MSIRNNPSVVAFYKAASAYCRILEDRPSADDAWGTKILHALSQLYACGHTLAEFSLDDGAPDLPEEFDVTDKQLSEIAARVGDYFARRDAYWDCLNSTAELYPQEASSTLISDDLADIYRDVAPGVCAWDSQRDELLQVIVFDWKFRFSIRTGVGMLLLLCYRFMSLSIFMASDQMLNQGDARTGYASLYDIYKL